MHQVRLDSHELIEVIVLNVTITIQNLNLLLPLLILRCFCEGTSGRNNTTVIVLCNFNVISKSFQMENSSTQQFLFTDVLKLAGTGFNWLRLLCGC